MTEVIDDNQSFPHIVLAEKLNHFSIVKMFIEAGAIVTTESADEIKLFIDEFFMTLISSCDIVSLMNILRAQA